MLLRATKESSCYSQFNLTKTCRTRSWKSNLYFLYFFLCRNGISRYVYMCGRVIVCLNKLTYCQDQNGDTNERTSNACHQVAGDPRLLSPLSVRKSLIYIQRFRWWFSKPQDADYLFLTQSLLPGCAKKARHQTRSLFSLESLSLKAEAQMKWRAG